MTTWHSSSFGWTAGQDVSGQFAQLAGTKFKAGDTMILDHMYKITGDGIRLPDNFTLAAVKGGGFDVRDTASKSQPLFFLGNGNKLDNITVTHSSAPKTGYDGNNPTSGVDYHDRPTFAIYNKTGVTVESSKFQGNVSIFLDVRGGSHLTVENSQFDGGADQIRLNGNCTDFRADNTLFQNALIDGIKTISSGGYGTQRATITDSIFENGRDGIDTTGGFKDSVVSNTIFRHNSVTGMDIKTYLENASSLNPNLVNSNIKIQDSKFVDSPYSITVTLEDNNNLVTASNADTWMPHDIKVSNTSFQGGKDAFLIKDGHHINWSNIELLGGISDARILNAEAPPGWSAHDIGGSSTTGPAQPDSNGYPFVVGPVAGGEGSGATVPPPPPVTPDPDPTPVPTPDPTPDPQPGTPSNNTAIFKVNSGGGASNGFDADSHYSGGFDSGGGSAIANTTEDAIYRTERIGKFAYSFDVGNGDYDVTLKFAEVYFDSAGKRLFDVKIENKQVLDNFDVFAAAGGKDIAIDKTFVAHVTDGHLDIGFSNVRDLAKISGVEISPAGNAAAAPASPAPAPSVGTQVSLNAGGSAANGSMADDFFFHGQTYGTDASIAKTSADAIYQTERFGNFDYSIPVENGGYDVALKFAEIYWDSAGKRVFDVKAEGKVVLDHFDIFDAAGGKNIAVNETVHVEVHDGSLDLSFDTIRDNAKISGIEITPSDTLL